MAGAPASLAMAPERGDRSLPAGTEGLPRVFLQSLRTLFDILDDRRRGYVHLREIESRWRGAEARELPAGVMEGLRQAAPASGYLTFERFVLGLRLSLLGLDQLCLEAACSLQKMTLRSVACLAQLSQPFLTPVPPGQRWEQVLGLVVCSVSPSLQDIPADHLTEVAPGSPLLKGACGFMPSSVAGGDAKSAGQCQGDGGHAGAGDARRHQRGRAEHRRHTITNGVDFSMLKYMKELEQEKDFLLQGLELIDRAREWYHQQIQLMQEHQRLLGKKRTSADFPEGGQSHLGRLVPKLQEVNRCLGDLLSTAGPIFSPPCWCLASTGSQQAINMLKEQNRLLTKEVTDKSERITQLEQEKSALIKQLFEARAHNNHEMSQLDSTFI
uniref:Suppressor APC domain containing 2 n=1 Tax=Malurus cyaneus samueli TaxID=2593467 RepID=A0A8C5X6Q4_9PASS